jgi:hypothetical protein
VSNGRNIAVPQNDRPMHVSPQKDESRFYDQLARLISPALSLLPDVDAAHFQKKDHDLSLSVVFNVRSAVA